MNATSPTLKKNPPILWAVAFIIFMVQSAVSASPTAISLDYCADQYLLALSDDEQIMAISKYATIQPSFYAEKAKSLKVLMIGEAIIDIYHFSEVIGKAGKEPILVAKQKYWCRAKAQST